MGTRRGPGGGDLVRLGQGALIGEQQAGRRGGCRDRSRARGGRLRGVVVAGGQAQVAAAVPVQVVGVVLADQAAVVHDADAGRQAGDLGQDVAGQQHRGAVPVGQVVSRARISATPAGSRPLTGSSRISRSGACSRALARPRRCTLPSDKVRARRSA